jgi:predicted metal-dependent hydrolase
MPKHAPGIVVRHVQDGTHTLEMVLTYDSRLRKTVRFVVRDEVIEVRAPLGIPDRELSPMLDEVVSRVLTQRARLRNLNDDELEARAHQINDVYFDGELHWQTIHWVKNMKHTLGSCSYGGPTDGDIRISSRIREWPEYVVNYVIAHELAHRKYPQHNKEFWTYLSAHYPQTERARGFIEGYAYASAQNTDDLL